MRGVHAEMEPWKVAEVISSKLVVVKNSGLCECELGFCVQTAPLVIHCLGYLGVCPGHARLKV